MDFDSARGLKTEQNYLWNDELTRSPRPAPVSAPGAAPAGNIYQLDTLRMGGFPPHRPIPTS